MLRGEADFKKIGVILNFVSQLFHFVCRTVKHCPLRGAYGYSTALYSPRVYIPRHSRRLFPPDVTYCIALLRSHLCGARDTSLSLPPIARFLFLCRTDRATVLTIQQCELLIYLNPDSKSHQRVNFPRLPSSRSGRALISMASSARSRRTKYLFEDGKQLIQFVRFCILSTLHAS